MQATPGIAREHADTLDREGYVVLADFMPPDLLAGLRGQILDLLSHEGEAAGAEWKQEPGSRRLANLVSKGKIFEQAFANQTVLSYVAHVLGPRYKLSSLNARSADPHNGFQQPLHVDMAAVPDERGPWVCNTVWMLDDFTDRNGPMRVVPGSHRLGRLPQDALDDPSATHPDEVLLTGRAGTVVVMNAHLWHGGQANQTDRPRLALHAFYCRRDKRQQQYQKGMIDAGVQGELAPAIRDLLALDDPDNDRLSVEEAARSGFMK